MVGRFFFASEDVGGDGNPKPNAAKPTIRIEWTDGGGNTGAPTDLTPDDDPPPSNQKLTITIPTDLTGSQPPALPLKLRLSVRRTDKQSEVFPLTLK